MSTRKSLFMILACIAGVGIVVVTIMVVNEPLPVSDRILWMTGVLMLLFLSGVVGAGMSDKPLEIKPSDNEQQIGMSKDEIHRIATQLATQQWGDIDPFYFKYVDLEGDLEGVEQDHITFQKILQNKT